MKLSELQQKTVDAIAAGKVTSAQALADAIGVDRKSANNVLGALRRSGTVAYDMLHPRAIDWSSVRVVGQAVAPAKAKRTRAPAKMAQKRARVPAAAPSAPSSSIEAARGATVDDEAIERFKGWAADLRAKATEIDAMVAALEGLPRLGARGALIFELLAKVDG